MQTITGELHRDLTTDSFWTRVKLISDKSDRKTEVLLCASYEYLTQDFEGAQINDKALRGWVVKTVADLQKKGEVLFRKPIHFEMKAITPQGYESGISFLKEKAESR